MALDGLVLARPESSQSDAVQVHNATAQCRCGRVVVGGSESYFAVTAQTNTAVY